MITNQADTRPDTAFSFQSWRENFLRIVLRGAVFFGLIALIPTLLTNTYPLFFVLYAAVYLALLIAAFASIPYLVRAWTFISLFYMLGVAGLFDTGIWGDARVFFVFMAAITAMLISPRAAVWVTAVTLFSTSIVAWFVLTGQLSLTTKEIAPGNLATWLSGAAVILMLDAIMIIGLSLLQDEIAKAQARASKSLGELEAERSLLEERVEARTRESIHKTAQLEAASSVARKISRIRDLQALLNDIVQTIAVQFRLYHAGVFLLDENEQNAVLMAASSEGGRELVKNGYRLRVGDEGMVGYVTAQARPRLALEVKSDPLFLGNPELPQTRSEMVLPLVARDRVIGALDLQSEIPEMFSEADTEVMQTLADQLATAIENARLFSERESIITQFEAITALQAPRDWGRFLQGRNPRAYQYTRTGIRPSTVPTLSENAKTLRLPLMLRGQEIGAINLGRKEAAPDWAPREREMAQEIAAQIVLALENARLLEETARRADMERVTSEITTRINSSTLYESIIQTAAEELSRALGGSEVLVQLKQSRPTNGAGMRNPTGRISG